MAGRKSVVSVGQFSFTFIIRFTSPKKTPTPKQTHQKTPKPSTQQTLAPPKIPENPSDIIYVLEKSPWHVQPSMLQTKYISSRVTDKNVLQSSRHEILSPPGHLQHAILISFICSANFLCTFFFSESSSDWFPSFHQITSWGDKKAHIPFPEKNHLPTGLTGAEEQVHSYDLHI